MCTASRRLLSRTFKLASSAGAIVTVLALAGTAWSGEKRNDEVFSLKAVVPIPGSPLVSFDISWVDPVLHNYYLADRNNKSVDVIDTSTTPPSFLTKFAPGFVGARGTIHDAMGNDTGVVCGPPTDPTICVSNNDVSGPDGVLTLPASGNKTQLWVGDGNSRVWVLDASSGNPVTVPPGATNPISTVSQDPMKPSNPNKRADETLLRCR